MTERKTGIVAVLSNRHYLALWLGQLLSKTGDNFAVVAALVIINQLAKAPASALVVVATALTLPQLFALATGVFIDRFSRKGLMILTDLLRAAVVLLPILVREAHDLYLLYIAAFALQAFGAIFSAARNASIPNMVPEEQLLTANALIQATDLLSLIVGASLATLVISLTGTASAFVIDSGSFVISALLLVPVHIPRARHVAATSAAKGELRRFWHSFIEGLHYIASNKTLLQLMVITTLATLGLSATVLVSMAFFRTLFGVSTSLLGLLPAMEGLGMAVGAVLIGAYASWGRSRRIVSVTMLVLGSGILLFVYAPRYWMVLIGAMIVGLCIVAARSTLAAMTQALVPDTQRGRVESAMVTVTGLGTMGALILGGLLSDRLGPRSIYLITGIAVLTAGITSVFSLRGAEDRLLYGANGQPSPPME